MARRVVTSDDVPWRLEAVPLGQQLSRVGGLDISFLETHPPAVPAAAQPHGSAAPGQDDASAAAATAGAASAPVACPAAADTAASSGTACDGCLASTCRSPPPGGNPPPDVPGDWAERPESAGPGVAALVVCSFPDMRVLYEDYEPVDLSIPYLPGYLGFRECDAYARLLRRAEGSPHRPQVLLVDGCGVLHPRGCGSACQIGITCDYPCVGVAKNLLAVDGLDRLVVRQQLQAAAAAAEAAGEVTAGRSAGSGADEQPAAAAAAAVPGPESTSAQPAAAAQPLAACTAATCTPADSVATAAGSDSRRGACTEAGTARHGPAAAAAPAAATAAAVRDVQVPLVGCSGAVHGVALCPGLSRKPLFISVGHRLSLATAVELVRRCCVHRVPEPIRQADLRSRQWLRNHAPTTAVASKG